MLIAEEGKHLDETERPLLGDVLARQGVLPVQGVEGVLGRPGGIGATERGKDLAGIIGCLAPGIRGAEGQLMPQIVGPQLVLPTIVVGNSGVTHLVKNPLIAILATYRIGNHGIGGWAGRYVGRNQIGKGRGQSRGVGVGVKGLEKRSGMIADVTRLDHGVAGNLALQPKGPALHVIGAEIGRNSILIETARVGRPSVRKLASWLRTTDPRAFAGMGLALAVAPVRFWARTWGAEVATLR